MDLPRSFTIREAGLRILNPFTEEKPATLGRALRLSPGSTTLDLARGKGEMLCTCAHDHAEGAKVALFGLNTAPFFARPTHSA